MGRKEDLRLRREKSMTKDVHVHHVISVDFE
jgi:hypothetical protein